MANNNKYLSPEAHESFKQKCDVFYKRLFEENIEEAVNIDVPNELLRIVAQDLNAKCCEDEPLKYTRWTQKHPSTQYIVTVLLRGEKGKGSIKTQIFNKYLKEYSDKGRVDCKDHLEFLQRHSTSKGDLTFYFCLYLIF